MSPTISRRALLQSGMSAGAAAVAGEAMARTAPEMRPLKSAPATLVVAVVQFQSGADIAENVDRHCRHIRDCAQAGAQVVVFPECSVTGYSKDIAGFSNAGELAQAEARIADAARAAGVHAVIGIPTVHGTAVYNSAIVVGRDGHIIERYHKVQLAGERWATPGDHLSVFRILGIPCSIIICHDERYPELVRLPVLAGAQVIFYISHESGVSSPQKMGPYRAQVQARAVENNVFVAHANAPADRVTHQGSHGESRVVAPDGSILTEAHIYGEEVLRVPLDLSLATRTNALRSPGCGFLQHWWEGGTKMVRRVEA